MLTFLSFQVQIEVVDDAWPNNPTTGTLTVNVDRNPSGPVFNPTTYTETLRANHPLGDDIIQLVASDSDGVCLK